MLSYLLLPESNDDADLLSVRDLMWNLDSARLGPTVYETQCENYAHASRV